ncbi:MAG TPA: phospholipase D family protein, partial [Anaerolineaceae bacterium]|nr:phospholipase D family protein [Anaerolineaceae bacterium]
MAKINIIRPLDQPIGRHRLLNDLETGLESSEYEEFLIIVAYARIGPLYKLSEHLKKWHIAGKKSKVIFGIDQKLTSYEALEFALHIFDEVYITQNIHTTFHPKIYMFIGKSKVRAIIGSNNLTIGGTETNFESAVDLELDTNTDSPFIEQLRQLWAELMPDSCPASQALDTTLLSQLQNELIVLSERNKLSNNPAFTSSGLRKQHSILHIKPPSSLPQDIPPVTRIDGANDRFIEGLSKIELISTGLIIQIKPHHNGEIFLSTI